MDCKCDSLYRAKIYFGSSVIISLSGLAGLVFGVVVILQQIVNTSEFSRETFYPIFLCVCSGIVGGFISLVGQIFFYCSYRDYYNAYQAHFNRRVIQSIDDESLQGFAALGKI